MDQAQVVQAGAPTLTLHCKCDKCASWEIEYEAGAYFLVCASCNEKIQIGFDIEPHAKLHWELLPPRQMLDLSGEDEVSMEQVLGIPTPVEE